MAALRGGANEQGRRRVFHGLLGAQVAVCAIVLLLANLFIASARRLVNEPPGFDPGRLLVLETVSRNDVPKSYAYWEQVRRHLGELTGVKSASQCGWALLTGNGWSGDVWVNGWKPELEETYFLGVSPGWLSTMGIPLKDGRDLRPEDRFHGAAIVNEAFARQFFRGENPVGKTVEIPDDSGRHIPALVVGLAADARYRSMREAVRPTLYVPFPDYEKGTQWGTFVVRTEAADPFLMADRLRREITLAQPDFRVVDIRSQDDLVRQQTARERLLAGLAFFFAAVALLLASLGLYGVMSYSVEQRRREIGIRMALGARPANVMRQVTLEAAGVVTVGTLIGLLGGTACEQLIAALLYQVRATDAFSLAVPALALLVAASVASLPPVLRAVRVDPAVTLRAD
jgi:predicted permease